jgi:hypothetical protein
MRRCGGYCFLQHRVLTEEGQARTGGGCHASSHHGYLMLDASSTSVALCDSPTMPDLIIRERYQPIVHCFLCECTRLLSFKTRSYPVEHTTWWVNGSSQILSPTLFNAETLIPQLSSCFFVSFRTSQELMATPMESFPCCVHMTHCTICRPGR